AELLIGGGVGPILHAEQKIEHTGQMLRLPGVVPQKAYSPRRRGIQQRHERLASLRLVCYSRQDRKDIPRELRKDAQQRIHTIEGASIILPCGEVSQQRVVNRGVPDASTSAERHQLLGKMRIVPPL